MNGIIFPVRTYFLLVAVYFAGALGLGRRDMRLDRLLTSGFPSQESIGVEPYVLRIASRKRLQGLFRSVETEIRS